MPIRNGFTLVELLVVITIIVILLALLAPALDKAIYQAELAVCGTRVRAIATGCTRPIIIGSRRAGVLGRGSRVTTVPG